MNPPRIHVQSLLHILFFTILTNHHCTNAQVSTYLNEPCLAVVKDIFEEDRQELLCQTPSGMLYIVPSVDDAWISRKILSGELVSGEVWLQIPAYTLVNRQTETLIYHQEPTLFRDNDESSGTRRRKLSRTHGQKTVLGVRVVASNSALTATENQLAQAIFGGPNDLVNLKSQFDACSHGKLQFMPRPDLNGLTTNIRNGIVTIRVNFPTSIGSASMVNAVSEALLREFGVTRSQIADHVMYCLPKGTFNGVAYAIINRGLSVYNDVLCTSVSTQMHEFGHNLNLGHSAMKQDEYGDQSGMMGYSYPYSEVPKMCFNVAKTYQLQWFRDKSISYTPGRGVWSYDKTFTVSSMVDYLVTNGYVIVQITQPQTGVHYFVGLNAAKGFNEGTRAGKDQVLVYEKPTVDATESRRMADLSTGQSFVIENFNGRSGDKVTITVQSIDLATARGSEAQVQIQLYQANGPNPPRPTPAPTPKPTAGRGVGGRGPSDNKGTKGGGGNSPNCKGIMEDCETDQDCCTGYSCRRISANDNFNTVCRAIAKNDKDKLPRANVNWWNRRGLRGDGNAMSPRELQEEEVIIGEEEE